MTWYANHLYAVPTPEILEILGEDPHLADHIYVVDSLERFRKTSREPYAVSVPAAGGEPVTEYREVVEEPAFPENGLAVVRELTLPDEHATEWFGDDGFDAAPLDSLEESLELGDDGPWGNVRRFCKALAARTSTVTGFFTTAFWGGDQDAAQAWAFADDHEYQYTLDPRGARAVSVRTGGIATERLVVKGDPLTLMLLHFDVLLRDAYFQLHTRSFPWEDFRRG